MILKRKNFSTAEEDKEAWEELMRLSKEYPRGNFSKELQRKAMRHEIRMEGRDPDKPAPRPTIIYNKKVKKFSISGRLKAAKNTYKRSKKMYESQEYKDNCDQVAKDLRAQEKETGAWLKTEEGKKAHKKDTERQARYWEKEKDRSVTRRALRDSYNKLFKDPYWMEDSGW